jgi:hypothetical protein
LKLKESDLSVSGYSQFIRANKITLSKNALFDRFLYNALALSTVETNAENELIKHMTFITAISNVITHTASEIDPDTLYDFKVSVLDYLNFASKKKLKDKNRKIVEKSNLEEQLKNNVEEIKQTIENSGLESKLSIEELMQYLQKKSISKNKIVYHHLLSQMDFIRKNLHRRSGTVKFLNQAMFLVKSLPKVTDQNNLILGIQSYIESVDSENIWSDSDDEWEY